jgi:hypothetical protein
LGIEVEPELIETAKEAIVEQGNAPPAGGVRSDGPTVGPAQVMRLGIGVGSGAAFKSCRGLRVKALLA